MTKLWFSFVDVVVCACGRLCMWSCVHEVVCACGRVYMWSFLCVVASACGRVYMWSFLCVIACACSRMCMWLCVHVVVCLHVVVSMCVGELLDNSFLNTIRNNGYRACLEIYVQLCCVYIRYWKYADGIDCFKVTVH